MKALIQDFIHQLIIYDYFLFGGIFTLFLLFLILAIVLRDKIKLAIFSVLFAFIILTVGPVAGYIALHQYLFQHTIILREVKALEFTEALLIEGDINNTSKRTFHECTVSAGVYKVAHNKFLDPIYPNIPFKKGALIVQKTIPPGKSAPFKLFVEPFRYTKDYNVTVKAKCR